MKRNYKSKVGKSKTKKKSVKNQKKTIYNLVTPDGYVYIGKTNRPVEERFEEHRTATLDNESELKVYKKLREFDWCDIEKVVVSEHTKKSDDILEIECYAINEGLKKYGDKLLNTVIPNKARYILRELDYSEDGIDVVVKIVEKRKYANGAEYLKLRMDIKSLEENDRYSVREFVCSASKVSNDCYSIVVNDDCRFEFNIHKWSADKNKAKGVLIKRRKKVKNVKSIMIRENGYVSKYY